MQENLTKQLSQFHRERCDAAPLPSPPSAVRPTCDFGLLELGCSIFPYGRSVTSEVFLHECGQIGDLGERGALVSFAEQPFSLAAIAVSDEEAFAHEIQAMKTRHPIHAAELKSSLRGNRSAFVYEVVRMICRLGAFFHRDCSVGQASCEVVGQGILNVRGSSQTFWTSTSHHFRLSVFTGFRTGQ